MKRLLLFLTVILPFVTIAQKPYTIKGFGKGFKNGDKIFLLYKEPGAAASTADSTIIVNGEFAFKGKIKNIVTGGLYRNTNPVYENIIKDSFTIYIEPGDILINSIDTLRNAIVSGTPLNDDYMVLQRALKPILDQQRKLKMVEELGEADQKNPVIVEALAKQWQQLSAQMLPIQLDFIRKHPTSFVSLVTLNSLARDKNLLVKVEETYALLSPSLKGLPMAKDVVRKIEFAKKINVGMMAKDFSQNNAEGKPVKLFDYKGKFILVDFWASWCLPCREENPNVIAAHQKYKDKNFEVLGVSLDDKEGKQAWLKAIKDDGLTWAQVTDFKGWKNEAAVLYGITSIPANVLIDPNGKVIAKDLKGKYLNEELARLFDK